jgi:cbb3-type cytochrome c oxidase subunit III
MKIIPSLRGLHIFALALPLLVLPACGPREDLSPLEQNVVESFREETAGFSQTSGSPPDTAPTAAATATPVAAAATAAHPADLAAAGEQIFTVFCSACHQPGATGLVGFAPSIRNRDFLALASDEFIRQTIRMGRPGTAMVPWTSLTEVQVDGIIAYLRALPVTNPVEITVNPDKKYSGDADKGHVSYSVYCASCHGPEGKGYAAGGSGPGIGLGGFLAVASDDYIYQTLKHGRAGSPMRPFMGAAGLANLDESEVGDIITYLRSLGQTPTAPIESAIAQAGDPATGEQQFNINCIACHQSGGVGLTGFAPAIRNRDFLAIASDDFIKQTVRAGRPGTAMIGRPDLSDQTLNDIIAYLRALPVANGIKVDVDPTKTFAGDTTAGHAKFATFCSACHGPKGEGYASGGSGPAIGLSGFLSAASDDYIYQTLVRGRVGTAMRPFLGPGGLANLSEEDASDIISYLRTLN